MKNYGDYRKGSDKTKADPKAKTNNKKAKRYGK
jgi:1,4-dihydroxy-2-naphthoate octaprenyltransferase